MKKCLLVTILIAGMCRAQNDSLAKAGRKGPADWPQRHATVGPAGRAAQSDRLASGAEVRKKSLATKAPTRKGRLTKRQRYLRWRALDRKQRAEVRELFRAAGVPYPAPRLHLRAFKHEGELELWASAGKRAPMRLIKRYAICATSGVLGPKRKQGDLQVPEGFYKLVRFTRYSSFHRSMRINYPNRLDRLRRRTGGAILIHGGCATIGCIPIRNAPIEELFRITLASHRKWSRTPITVHIYPRRMTPSAMAALASRAGNDGELLRFWRDLQPAYLAFEKRRRVPTITIGRDRRYSVPSTR